ncbi:hypothetical protein AsGV065 [Agrotis segetum granulovirus]|uniref:Uncharacterized protein n=1 Tax=Agrotis segetum granulosis virus TaxID=10464 RepID=A0A023MIL8_GVAS|nr:hypothetical protein AsGV065 [Agrotis segetum granulovirus]AHN92104.1 hypothetical protein AsGV065 [Agrotis segetum granulovirus]AKN63339.1 hypothetical protein AsGV065 [Agrotis segetum granulovirus]
MLTKTVAKYNKDCSRKDAEYLNSNREILKMSYYVQDQLKKMNENVMVEQRQNQAWLNEIDYCGTKVNDLNEQKTLPNTLKDIPLSSVIINF